MASARSPQVALSCALAHLSPAALFGARTGAGCLLSAAVVELLWSADSIFTLFPECFFHGTFVNTFPVLSVSFVGGIITHVCCVCLSFLGWSSPWLPLPQILCFLQPAVHIGNIVSELLLLLHGAPLVFTYTIILFSLIASLGITIFH